MSKEPFDLWFEGNEEDGMIFMVAPDGGDICLGVSPLNLPLAKWISETCGAAWVREADQTPLLWADALEGGDTPKEITG